MITPELTALGARLAEIVAKNAAGAVASKVAAIRARKLDQAAMNELIELVNDLIADKNDLIGIAQGFEQELVAQRISESDITYITNELLPVVERLAALAEDSRAGEAVAAVKGLVTKETLTIMQLIGFNFRRAIGEPLTTLAERLILGIRPPADRATELQALQLRREAAYFEASLDSAARDFLRN